MAGKTINIEDILEPDRLGCAIARKFQTWWQFRQVKEQEWKEVQKYVYATDTTKTTNSKLSWSNKTTLPKLCQIRDNLFANYMASMFPKKKNVIWEGASQEDEDQEKRKIIEAYITWVMDRNEFYDEVSKLVLDYIDYGNCFGTVEWVDHTSTPTDGSQARKVGYVGPMLRRICPLDIVLNPTAPSFLESPKIIRSLVSLGEVKEMLERDTADPQELEDAMELYSYLKGLRLKAGKYAGDSFTKDEIYSVDGFTSYRNYLECGTVEVLTFYGDVYNEDTDTFQRNRVIKVVDRHKVISNRPNPSYFGTAPIYHAGWRLRPDNVWAMGPLDNLVGMQYRIDHLENMKADCFDLIAYPPIKIKGYVEDFTWGPFERIHVSEEGDVEVMSPDVNALNADNQIAILEAKMEEMAGSPKEAMGFRTPGEKTAYEVQRLENAASRIFQNKIAQFERSILENLLNAMLELARRQLNPTTLRIFDTEYKVAQFKALTAEDITGNGRIKPIAARHFAEQSQIVQNLNQFYASPAYQSVAPHFSSVKAARLWEHLLELEDYDIVEPFIQITEQADAARMSQSAQQSVMMEGQTAAGMQPGDHDPEAEASGNPYPMGGALAGSGEQGPLSETPA